MIIDTLHIEHLEAFYFKGFLFGKTFESAHQYVKNGIDEQGEAFVSELNGSFCGYCFDQANNQLTVFNDRLGMSDLYLYQDGNRLIISDDYSSIHHLINDTGIDYVAIGEMIKFQTPLFSRTLHPKIKLCSNASLISIDTNTLTVEESRYWHFNATPHERDKKSLKKDFIDIYVNAIAQCFNEPDKQYVIANSGGLDSRCNIYIANQLGMNYQTYTYGQGRSDAYYIAHKIEKKLHLKQHYIKVDDDFLKQYSDIHIQNRPMMPLNYCWYQSAYKYISQFDVNITGFDANFLEAFTHMDVNGHYKAVKHADKQSQLRYNYNLHSVCSGDLFGQLFNASDKMLNYESYIAEMEHLNSTDIYDQFDEFEQINRQRRLTKAEPWMNYYGKLEARSPIIHNDMIDFSLSLPLSHRLDRILYKEAMADYLGKIGQLRFERMPWGLTEPKGIKRKLMETVWKVDHKLYKKIGHSFWFKGAHKNIKSWMVNTPNSNFIEALLHKPNPVFDEIFNKQFIIANYQKLIRSNFIVMSSILSVKMYLDKQLAHD